MNRRTRIKICGLKDAEALDAAVQAGADAVGFVFFGPSPRAVTIDQAAALARRLPPFVTPVGLFVNTPADEIAAALRAMPGLLLQFHGDEPPEDCERWGRPYLRALAMSAETRLVDWQRRFLSAQALLVDAPVASGYGGGGKVFDWSLLAANGSSHLVLSGGLNAANVGDGIRRVRPWAVDVSSGVESSRGVKSPDLIHQFCAAVRAADAAL